MKHGKFLEKVKKFIASYFKKMSQSARNTKIYQSKCIKIESTCMSYYSTFIFANDKSIPVSFKLRCKVPTKSQKNNLLPNLPHKKLSQIYFHTPY